MKPMFGGSWRPPLQAEAAHVSARWVVGGRLIVPEPVEDRIGSRPVVEVVSVHRGGS
jgi:hypothetical protein